MDELNYIIANNITTLRTRLGITQLELALMLDYSDKLISKWERGDSTPNAHTLKRLSEIFNVSIDYLFTDHRDSQEVSAEAEAVSPKNKLSRINTGVITAIVVVGIWMLALLMFVVSWILKQPIATIFVYAIPVTMITLLVLNSVWNEGKHNRVIIFMLIASIFLDIYVALLKYNLWQIFLLLLPAELIVILSGKIKRT